MLTGRPGQHMLFSRGGLAHAGRLGQHMHECGCRSTKQRHQLQQMLTQRGAQQATWIRMRLQQGLRAGTWAGTAQGPLALRSGACAAPPRCGSWALGRCCALARARRACARMHDRAPAGNRWSRSHVVGLAPGGAVASHQPKLHPSFQAPHCGFIASGSINIGSWGACVAERKRQSRRGPGPGSPRGSATPAASGSAVIDTGAGAARAGVRATSADRPGVAMRPTPSTSSGP